MVKSTLKIKLYLTSLLIFKLELYSCVIKLTPIVTLPDGGLKGSTMKSRNGQTFYAFMGIQFGVAGRFEKPKPAPKWSGVRLATTLRECVYVLPGELGGMMGMRGEEDCLYLNVFTPHLPQQRDKLMPVMVWIHGGAFIMASGGLFNPDYVMDEDVVFVSINYRLGALGFLYTEDDAVPGNLGIRDQILALKWVQKNVRHFGGDPNLVTIFGQSAGAMSISVIVLSPMAVGLFHRAIIMSGSVCAASIVANPRWHAERFAQDVGCPLNDTTAMMINCLKTVDAENIAETQAEQSWGPIPAYHWAPMVEVMAPNSKNSDYVLTEHPFKLLAKQKIASRVPTMIGVVKNEGVAIFGGLILQAEELVNDMNSNWTGVAPFALIYYNKLNYSEGVNTASEKIRQFYFNDFEIGPQTEQRFSDLYSDRVFIHGAQTMAFALANAGIPVYSYLYTYYSGFSFFQMFGYTNYEPPTHGDDLAYIFPTILKPTLGSKDEVIFSQNLVRLYTSFARAGVPESTWGGVEWPPINMTDERTTWFKIDKEPQLWADPYKYRREFWDDLVNNELKGIY